jgi:hypothetical protein
MKNFTLPLYGYCNAVVKYLKKEVTLKSLLQFSLLLSPLLSTATEPGLFSTATPVKKQAVTFANNGVMYRQQSYAAPLGTTESIRTNLYLLMADSSRVLADGVYTEYNNLYHDSVTLEDAAKFTNIKENLGLLRYGKTLSVERRPIIISNDTLFLKLWKTTQRSYQIELVANMTTNVGLQAYFVDNYLRTSTPVGIGNTTKINFAINADVASSDIYRFKIIFKPLVFHGLLPVTFTSVKAYQQGENIAVNWKVQNEEDMVKYEVEKSINGKDFTVVNTILVNGTNNGSGNYVWIDDNHVTGNNFYRIKAVNLDGSSKYTTVVRLMPSKAGASFMVYPNPVKGNTINLQFVDQTPGIYQVTLINLTGQVVYTNKLPVTSNSLLQPLNLGTSMLKGMYQLEIKSADNITQVKKIMIQ